MGPVWNELFTPAQHINFGHSHFPPKIPPNRQKWGPQNEFPRITRTKGFCGNSTEILNFPEFPGPSRFRILGSPFSAFWGGNEVDMLGSADELSFPATLCRTQFFIGINLKAINSSKRVSDITNQCSNSFGTDSMSRSMSSRSYSGNAQRYSRLELRRRNPRRFHAPPPQNRRLTSRVQNWGWCVFCLFLRFRQFAHHPPKNATR